MENSVKNASDLSERVEIQPVGTLLPANDAQLNSQVRLVIIVALAVFICEAIVMLVISVLPTRSIWLGALFDATLLVIVLSPVLYFCLFRTLVRHIHWRRQVEEELGK